MVSEFLPTKGAGATLLTTRSQVTGQHIKKIGLEKWNREDGISFLLHRSGLLDEGVSSDEVPEQEREVAEQIYQLMDGLPLALDQAAAYVEESQCGLMGYLSLYQTRRSLLLHRRSSLSQYPASVATTWSLSFQRIEESRPVAAELLRLCAFLAPDAIVEEVLTTGASQLGPMLAPVAADSFLLNQAIEALRAYSLVQRDPKEKTLSVHRLVQAVLQDQLSEAERRTWAERAILAVNAVFPDVEPGPWSPYERLLSQALHAAQRIEDDQIRSPEAARLLYQTAQYLKGRSRYAEAEPLYRQALHIQEQTLGPEHLDVAYSLRNLATLYYEQGKYAEVGPLYQRSIQILKQRLGPEHLDLVWPLNSQIAFYYEQGAFADNGLGNLYYEQGKDAEALYLRSLQTLEHQLGPEHPYTAYLLNDLANLYREQSRYVEAEALLQRALQIMEQQFGPEHIETADIMYDFALFEEARDHGEEASEWYARALAIREQTLGAHHPKTTETRTRLIALASRYAKELGEN